MSETKEFIIIMLVVIMFATGMYVGTLVEKEPKEIYVFESKQPVRPHFEKELPKNIEYHVIEWVYVYYDKGYQTKEYLLYYWIEPGFTGQELHWTWREVTGP